MGGGGAEAEVLVLHGADGGVKHVVVDDAVGLWVQALASMGTDWDGLPWDSRKETVAMV